MLSKASIHRRANAHLCLRGNGTSCSVVVPTSMPLLLQAQTVDANSCAAGMDGAHLACTEIAVSVDQQRRLVPGQALVEELYLDT